MTIIKQGGVSSKSHQRNLRAYINDDKKVLLRDSQNMEECKDLKRWASYMERTRKTFGHDKAARRIRDRKTGELKEAKNTVTIKSWPFFPTSATLTAASSRRRTA